MVKKAVAAMCVFPLLATAYLTASLLLLRPPRANYQQSALVACVIVVQGTLTLVALYSAGARNVPHLPAARGLALAVAGAVSIYRPLPGPQLHGERLLLGYG